MSQNDNSANLIGNNEENSAQNMLHNLFVLPPPTPPPISIRRWQSFQLYDNPRSSPRRPPSLPPRRNLRSQRASSSPRRPPSLPPRRNLRSQPAPSVTTINVEPGSDGEVSLYHHLQPASSVTTTINVEPGSDGGQTPPLPMIMPVAQQEGLRHHRRNAIVTTDFIDILLNSVVRPSRPSEHHLRPQEYNLLANTLYSEPTYKTVISEEGSKELKKINYKKGSGYNSSCPIFRTEFEQNQEITLLPCNHCFVPSAIAKWLEEQSAECPVCRHKLPSKEIHVEEKVAELDEESSTFRGINRPTTLPMSSMLTHIAQNIIQQEETDIQRAILASLDNY